MKDNKGDLEKIFNEQRLDRFNESLINNNYWISRLYNDLVSHLDMDITLTHMEGDLQMAVKKFRKSVNSSSQKASRKIPYLSQVVNYKNETM